MNWKGFPDIRIFFCGCAFFQSPCPNRQRSVATDETAVAKATADEVQKKYKLSSKQVSGFPVQCIFFNYELLFSMPSKG
jgi:hypothetical protein